MFRPPNARPPEPLPRQAARCALALLGSACLGACARDVQAQDEREAVDAPAAPSVRVEHGTGWAWTSIPAARPRDALAPGVSPMAGTATHTLLWLRQARWSAGLGVAQRSALQAPGMAASAAPADALLLVAAGWGLPATGASRSQLTWQAPLSAIDADGSGVPRRQMRVGLSFSNRDPYADLRRGALMKFELSGQTALALRPRGGRLGLALSSRW